MALTSTSKYLTNTGIYTKFVFILPNLNACQVLILTYDLVKNHVFLLYRWIIFKNTLLSDVKKGIKFGVTKLNVNYLREYMFIGILLHWYIVIITKLY